MLKNYQFQSMSLTNLIDLLAAYTIRYTQLLAEKNFGEEYNSVKETIKQLQAIIETRRESDSTHLAGDRSFTSNSN